MDYKKTSASNTTITRNLEQIATRKGDNVYEAIVVMAKRANQIGTELKRELDSKLEEFASYNDNLEEVFENREQIEISRFYERLPKPSLIATQDYIEDKISYKKSYEDSEDVE